MPAILKRRIQADPGSDSDSDAPETFTLAQSEISVKSHANAVREAHDSQRKKIKEKNRARDQRAKERATLRKQEGGAGVKEKGEKGKKDDSAIEVTALEARMMRAMEEAEVEDDGDEMLLDLMDEDIVANGYDELDDEEWIGVDSHGDKVHKGYLGVDEEDHQLDESEQLVDDDDEESNRDEDHSPKLSSADPLISYLPDDLFTAAFAASSRRSRTEDAGGSNKPPTGKKNQKRTKKSQSRGSAKEIVLGSRLIHVLPANKNLVLDAARRAAPAPGVENFLSRQLKLKKSSITSTVSNVPSKSIVRWQRRPVHLGALKSHGPARQFARNS